MPDVRMNYGSMEEMKKAFHQAYEQLQTTKGEMEKAAKLMEDGALVGQAGDAFKNAIRSTLLKRIEVIAAKMSELERDIQGAVEATRDGVTTAQSRFK